MRKWFVDTLKRPLQHKHFGSSEYMTLTLLPKNTDTRVKATSFISEYPQILQKKGYTALWLFDDFTP